MLTGIRWQVLALFASLVIFGLVLTFRLNQARPEPAIITATYAPSLTPAPTFTAAPTEALNLSTPLPEDRVVTFTEAAIGSVQRLNPLLIGSQAERDITSLIYEGLTRINEFGEPVGALAQRWEISRDGYEYVLVLRQDILWQDGIPFTAEDVRFTYNLLASPDYPFVEIGRFWQTVELEVLDSHVVRFRLAQPLASFLSLLTTGILPEHALRGTTVAALISHPFNLSPIGTGAYQLEGLRSTNGQQIDAVDLRVAPTFRQRSEGQSGYAIERLRFRFYPTFDNALAAFVAGDVQGLASQQMQERAPLLQLGSANVFTEIEPTLGVLLFNWDEPEGTRFFSDIRVRNGLQLGLNRDTSVARVLYNQAILADSPIRPDSWAFDGSIVWPQADAQRAQDILNSANILAPEEMNLGDKLYRFSILTLDTPAFNQLAQEIANQWAQYNLEVTVEAVASDVFSQRLNDGDFDVVLVELPLDADPDGFAYWHADQYPDGLNYGGANDSRINELLERGRQEPFSTNRIGIYRDFQRNFINQVLALPLYYPLYTYAVSEEIAGVQLGFIHSPEDRFRTLANWTYP
jgi:peptide/nickel transport system substrate-binding protein